uniref:C-type lectin domain-containing protein n=1 Tax=Equus asinus TaxID=9793 RepID=A0A9L0IM22_EQUAS
MKLWLLAVLSGAVSALHLEHGTMEAPMEELMLLEEEEEGGSGDEDAPEEEGAVKSVSALEEVDKDFLCPKEEDTVKQVGIPGCKTCRFVVVVRAMTFSQAQYTWQRCYWGKLVSIHNLIFTYHIQCPARSVSQGQGWISGMNTGFGSCRRFYWVDGSAWNIWYWALSQQLASGGSCVSMWNRGDVEVEMKDDKAWEVGGAYGGGARKIWTFQGRGLLDLQTSFPVKCAVGRGQDPPGAKSGETRG